MEILVPISLQLFILWMLVRGAKNTSYRLKDSNHYIQVAKSWLTKRVGLLNHAIVPQNSSLLLWNCRSIHTIGMAEAIDVIFLDRHLNVLKIESAVPVGVRSLKGPSETRHILETAAGLNIFKVNEQLNLLPR